MKTLEEKLNIFDQLFDILSEEDLQEILESKKIVDKLSGNFNHSAFFTRLHQANQNHTSRITSLEYDVTVLKSDIKDLIRSINQTVFHPPYSNEFQNLKQRHCI